jgi:hypothetical protein
VTAPPTAQPNTRLPAAPPFSLARVLFIVGAAMFIIAAFAAGGHLIDDIPEWSWAFGGFAAWMLSGAARST